MSGANFPPIKPHLGPSASQDQTLVLAGFAFSSGLIALKIDMEHLVLEKYQESSNNDFGLTLTYFMARSNMGKI